MDPAGPLRLVARAYFPLKNKKRRALTSFLRFPMSLGSRFTWEPISASKPDGVTAGEHPPYVRLAPWNGATAKGEKNDAAIARLGERMLIHRELPPIHRGIYVLQSGIPPSGNKYQ